jgi:hypothetical protein
LNIDLVFNEQKPHEEILLRRREDLLRCFGNERPRPPAKQPCDMEMTILSPLRSLLVMSIRYAWWQCLKDERIAIHEPALRHSPCAVARTILEDEQIVMKTGALCRSPMEPRIRLTFESNVSLPCGRTGAGFSFAHAMSHNWKRRETGQE